MARIYLFYGVNGTTKTSAALDDTCWYAELDAGSFDRSYHEGKQVEVQSFYAPPTALEDLGKLSTAMVGATGKGAVQIVHRYTGWRTAYAKFIKAYLDFCQSEMPTGVIDTTSKLWVMARNALRERIQDEVPADQQGDRLKRLEYEEPNSQFHSIIEAAKAAKKNLVLVAHEGEVWKGGEPTGVAKPDGWNESSDEADVIVRFVLQSRKPVGIIEKGNLALIGMKLEWPTLQKVNETLDAAQMLLGNGKTPEQVREALEA